MKDKIVTFVLGIGMSLIAKLMVWNYFSNAHNWKDIICLILCITISSGLDAFLGAFSYACYQHRNDK